MGSNIWSENSLAVLKGRYLKGDETPEGMFKRVAIHLAVTPDEINSFYHIMSELKFIPNTPCLINAGRPLGQLAACFVLPIEDSIESIFETLKNTALIHKSGGGTGFDFSNLRPANFSISTTGSISSGPISFMKIFDAATNEIKQGGVRRGANMACLSVHHPDILEFIKCKGRDGILSNFNISVTIDDSFIECVKSDILYGLYWDKKMIKQLKAGEVFKSLAKSAWETGEPGILFIDTINKENKGDRISATNPCAELPLRPYESCVLGSINLEKHFYSDQSFGINFKTIRETTKNAIIMLNRMIDTSKSPLPEIEKATKGSRRIGLGIMGFAKTLYRLGIRYGSEECMKFIDDLMLTIKDVSIPLQQQFGNETVFTIAPTGSISMIADTSSGIEPVYSLSFYKNVMNKSLLYTDNYFLGVAKKEGFYTDTLINSIIENRGSVKGLPLVPEEWQRVFVTAYDLTFDTHIKVQARFQKYVDNAISKTINMASDSTVEDAEKAIMLAYETGCKGITIYRNGCRANQVLTNLPQPNSFVTPQRRPNKVEGSTIKTLTSCGDIYTTCNIHSESLFEVFCTMGKAGGCEPSQIEAIGRLISLALRSGVAPVQIIRQLKGIRCNKPCGVGKKSILSCADAIGKAISKITNIDVQVLYKNGCCPECNSETQMQDGCELCSSCGFSRC